MERAQKVALGKDPLYLLLEKVSKEVKVNSSGFKCEAMVYDSYHFESKKKFTINVQ